MYPGPGYTRDTDIPATRVYTRDPAPGRSLANVGRPALKGERAHKFRKVLLDLRIRTSVDEKPFAWGFKAADFPGLGSVIYVVVA